MANKEYLETLTKEEFLIFLDTLEKSCGGHGNGVLFIDNGQISLHHKSVGFSNKTIANLVYTKLRDFPDWFLYHTRIASKGTVKDENCHPYVTEDNTFALMMNGTEATLGAFGKHKDITDTEVIFEMMHKMNIPLETLTDLSPRFMGFKDGKVFATNPSEYQGLKYKQEGKAICIASEFPLGYKDVKTLKRDFVWCEGEELKEEPVYVSTGYTGYYNNSYFDYEAYRKGLKKEKDLIEKYKKEKTKEEKDIEDLNKASCASCCTDSEKYWNEYTLEEFKEKLDEVTSNNSHLGMIDLQEIIDEVFGIVPIINDKFCDIIVLETRQVIIQDEDGEIYEVS